MIYFPGATWMFRFAPCPANFYIKPCGNIFKIGSPPKAEGLLHSETAGSKVYGTSPTSIAAVCVLPRPKSPRHSLSALWVDLIIFNSVKFSVIANRKIKRKFFSSLVKEPTHYYLVCSGQRHCGKRYTLDKQLSTENSLSLKEKCINMH